MCRGYSQTETVGICRDVICILYNSCVAPISEHCSNKLPVHLAVCDTFLGRCVYWSPPVKES